jgi:hypothetical protein
MIPFSSGVQTLAGTRLSITSVSDSVGYNEAREFAFLTSSKVITMLIWGSYLRSAALVWPSLYDTYLQKAGLILPCC